MMKLLYNPKDGAPIKDVWYKYSKYFTEPFLPGKVIKIDETLANFVLETFGFVQEITVAEAKKLMEKGEEIYPCDKCAYKATAKIALFNHAKTHVGEEELDGIQTIKIVTVETVGEKKKKHDPFAVGEAEDRDAGLDYGEGLVNEAPQKTVVMR